MTWLHFSRILFLQLITWWLWFLKMSLSSFFYHYPVDLAADLTSGVIVSFQYHLNCITKKLCVLLFVGWDGVACSPSGIWQTGRNNQVTSRRSQQCSCKSDKETNSAFLTTITTKFSHAEGEGLNCKSKAMTKLLY